MFKFFFVHYTICCIMIFYVVNGREMEETSGIIG